MFSKFFEMFERSLDWLDAHPFLQYVLLMMILPAAVSVLTKPRSPEEEAKMNPYVAAFLRAWRKFFPDPRGVTDTVVRVVTRGKGPPNIPPPPFLPVLLILLLGAFASPSCKGAEFPQPSERAAARAGIIALAEGIGVSAQWCRGVVQAGQRTKDLRLAAEYLSIGDDCVAALVPAEEMVIAAAEALDDWQDAASQKTALARAGCAGRAVLKGLRKMLDLFTRAKLEAPAEIVDAMAMARWLEPFAEGACYSDPSARKAVTL